MSATEQRWILHADMDAFFASVEQRDFPELRGLPVVVGGRSPRSVVAAASYEARHFGIYSAMPVAQALKRCPDLICQPGRMSVYQDVSREVFEVFNQFTPCIEGLSVDEAFLDISASLNLFGSALNIAKALKAAVFDKTQLRVSVGIAPNKLLAKIASDLDKPDGLTMIEPDRIAAILDPLPVKTIPGIGRKTLPQLSAQGIFTIGQLRLASDHSLERVFGKHAGSLRARARGEDERPVVVFREDKSISAEETFADDTNDQQMLERTLMQLVERVGTRLRDKNLQAACAQIKVRRADFQTYTRQKTLHPASNSTDALFRAARNLLHGWLNEQPTARLRLLGMGTSNFQEQTQIDLFQSEELEAASELDKTVDSIRSRFGGASLARARSIDNKD
ncbi:MAG: DNA polymerase IV [Pseudomonadota bacterium]